MDHDASAIVMTSTLRTYTARDVKLSRDIYRYLRNEADVIRTGFLTYKDVGDAVGVHHRTIRGALYYLQDRCLERGLPTFTVFVVRKSSGLPGGGCDVVMPQEVVEAVAQIRSLEWPADPWW